MKLLIITDFYPPDILGGAERTSYVIRAAFRDIGHNVFIICGAIHGCKRDEGIFRILDFYTHPHGVPEKLPIVRKSYIDLCSFIKSMAVIRAVQPDVVLVRSVRYISFRAVTAAMFIKIPVVVFAPDTWLSDRRKACREEGVRGKLRNFIVYNRFGFQKIACPSQDLVREFIKVGFKESEICFIPHGVDVKQFRPMKPIPLRREKTLLFVGRLYWRKGPHVAIRALKLLHDEGFTEIRLVIVGEGDRKYSKALREEVRKLNIEEKVHFKGKVEQENLPRIFSDASVVIMPSYDEPFGIVAIEAMSCGRPLVASRVGGLIEIVSDGIDGILIPPNDAASIAAAVREIFEIPERANAMGHAARMKVLKNFSKEQFVLALEGVLNEAIRQRSKKVGREK